MNLIKFRTIFFLNCHLLNFFLAMKTASSSFYQTINSIYEDDWNGKPVISSLNNVRVF